VRVGPASGFSAELRSGLALSFGGHPWIDLAENRFVLLLFSQALAIPENPMQNVKPTDLSSAADRLSPVSGAINRVIAIASVPLLPGEREADYASLAARVVGTAKPEDAIEELLVRDVVDLTWEVFRLRRARAGVLKASMSDGVRVVLDGLGHGGYTQHLGQGWAAGDKSARREVEVALTKAGLTIDELTAATVESKLDSFERRDRMLASAEARRNNALREVERHRAALGGAARRSVEEIEDAEFRDVETGSTTVGVRS
jgi:hypothetical protein